MVDLSEYKDTPEDNDDVRLKGFLSKKLGEPCNHPLEHRLKEVGRLLGVITVCRLCGQLVKDPDNSKA